MLSERSTADLVQIAAAGGGIHFSTANRTMSELLEIASAVARGRGSLCLRDFSNLTTSELIEIAAAGRGRVVFVDADPL